LDSTLRATDAENPSLLEAILEVVDSSITFRSRYNLVATLPAVFDLVLLDDKNPRSVLFQLNQLAKHFEKLPKEREDAPGSGKQLLARCVRRMNQVDARELASLKNRREGDVGAALRETLQTLPRLSDAIAASYFAHAEFSRTGRGRES
jgi:uncharacterized alpha-E superfamily protein